jgi:hypothetical protein
VLHCKLLAALQLSIESTRHMQACVGDGRIYLVTSLAVRLCPCNQLVCLHSIDAMDILLVSRHIARYIERMCVAPHTMP